MKTKPSVQRARGEGWWIDLRSKRSTPSHEHLAVVLASPAKFRLKHSDLYGSRSDVLKRVLKKGFCRVRSVDASTVFEFDFPNAEAMKVIKAFMRRMGVVGFHGISIFNFRTGKWVLGTADEVLK